MIRLTQKFKMAMMSSIHVAEQHMADTGRPHHKHLTTTWDAMSHERRLFVNQTFRLKLGQLPGKDLMHLKDLKEDYMLFLQQYVFKTRVLELSSWPDSPWSRLQDLKIYD